MKLPKWTRFAAAIAVVSASSLVLAVGLPSSAQAATPVTPISVLPSQIVKGTSAATTADAQIARMAQVYKFLTAPSTVAALKAQSAGTATAAQTAEIATAASSSRIPLALGGLSKVAGAAGVAYTGYKIGTGIGASQAGKITTSLYGVDANQLVCEQAAPGSVGQGFLSFFSGQDCADFNAGPELVPNQDAKGGATMAPYTSPDGGRVFTYTGFSTWTDGIYSSCFNVSATGDGGAQVFYNVGNATLGKTIGSYTLRGGDPSICGKGVGDTPFYTVLQAKASDVTELCITSLSATDCSAGNKMETLPANPDRFISCNITDSNGGQSVAQGGLFKETDADWNAAIPQCPTLDAGLLPIKTQLILHTTGGSDQTLWEHDMDQSQRDSLEKNKDCLTTVCQLILEKDGKSCFDTQGLCTGWFADPHKEDTYTCRYNGAQVELTECNVYAPSWESDAVRTGEVYGDPVTGTAAKPSTSTKENDAVSPGLGSSTANDPADKGKECFPTGWGVLNPIEWVQKPAQCALTWAFVPSPDVMTAAQAKIEGQAKGTMPGKVATTIGGMSFVPAMGGCDGIAVPNMDVGVMHVHIGRVMRACDGDVLQPMAQMVQVVAGFAIAFSGLIGLSWIIASPLGYRGIGMRGGDE